MQSQSQRKRKSGNRQTTKTSKMKIPKSQPPTDESNDLNDIAFRKSLNHEYPGPLVSWPRVQCYRIVEFISVFGVLEEVLRCMKCKEKVTFQQAENRGFGFKLIVTCLCGCREIYSGPLIENDYEINTRIVYVMKLLGIGREGLNMFSWLMDFGRGLTQSVYEGIVRQIHEASSKVFDGVREKAVAEEKEESIDKRKSKSESELKILADGSWKKRGFGSLFGVMAFFGYYTGKLIDLVVKNQDCQYCITWRKNEGTNDTYTDWYEKHKKACCNVINDKGSVSKIEVDAAMEMFLRSEKKFGVKYLTYIGDDNSKTSEAIVNLKPYGHQFPLSKSQSEDHITKCSCERFNLAVWRLAPEHLNLGEKSIETAAFISACIFNEGFSAVLKIMKNLKIQLGCSAGYFADAYDSQRISMKGPGSLESIRAARRWLSRTRDARAVQRLKAIRENEFHEEEDGLIYCPGMVD